MMELVTEGHKDSLIVRIKGEILAETSSELRDFVMVLLQRLPKTMVVELGETKFIDTSGLGTLVGLRTHARARGCKFSIANPTREVRNIFRLTHLDKLFELPE